MLIESPLDRCGIGHLPLKRHDFGDDREERLMEGVSDGMEDGQQHIVAVAFLQTRTNLVRLAWLERRYSFSAHVF